MRWDARKSFFSHAAKAETVGRAFGCVVYQVPTPIQRKCIPIILDGKDVVAMARTG